MRNLRNVIGQIANLRVVPPIPDGHRITLGAIDASAPAFDSTPDAVSALSFLIYYDGGTLAEGRRVTLRRIEAQGSALRSFLAHCHERGAPRSFRADRVAEAVDLATGEVLDCRQFHDFVMTRSGGLLESRLLSMAKLLVFLGRCDGRMVASEWNALDHSLVRLQRALLDDDSGADLLIEEARRLAPDGRDTIKTLRSLGKTRLPQRVHAELRRAIGALIDADGIHHRQEVTWSLEIADAIDTMPTCA